MISRLKRNLPCLFHDGIPAVPASREKNVMCLPHDRDVMNATWKNFIVDLRDENIYRDHFMIQSFALAALS
jgi:hypothetical protein